MYICNKYAIIINRTNKRLEHLIYYHFQSTYFINLKSQCFQIFSFP